MERARAVIPHGIWGHNRFPASYTPGEYPYFTERGEGAHVWDVDGNRYIDYLCAFGAMINGYANPVVDEAARAQAARGDCFAQPAAVGVELAEYLCSKILGAEWCAFSKSGSDATWTAVMIARAFTRRSDVVCVRGAFHGSHGWCNGCNPGEGRAREDAHAVHAVEWNDANDLERIFQERGDRIACVVTTPFHHPIPGRAALPSADFVRAIREVTDRHGAIHVVDDVRAGFRLDLRGSHAYFGLEPDLICFSKALANTHPLACVVGTDKVRRAAESIFTSGTFWKSAAPMAAALANLEFLPENDGLRTMMSLGQRLVDGLVRLGQRHSVPLEMTGPVTMPTMTIAGDVDQAQMRRFAVAMAEQGSLVHPSHNWFVSAAHRPADIEQTLGHADVALASLAPGGAARARP
jgi:glutamate-1-semialdehyde 2,1-aminomutase